MCWTTSNRKFGVKLSTFRKKLNIYSYVPGDSDHHPCVMQSTIRGELTRLWRTNSSVDSVEQEVKFFRLKWTRERSRRQRVGSNRQELPVARQENAGCEARRKSSRSPLCTKYCIPGVCVIFLFRRVINKHVKVVQSFFWVVSASHLWLAQLLQTSSDECGVSRGRTADGRVKVECLLQF